MIETGLVVFFLLAGTFFMMVAAIGIFTMPDVYNQLHTSTKAITLSLVNLLLGAIIYLGSISVGMKAFLILAFQFITAPVSAHMISRVQHPNQWKGTIVDEMTDEPTAARGEEQVDESVAVDDETTGGAEESPTI